MIITKLATTKTTEVNCCILFMIFIMNLYIYENYYMVLCFINMKSITLIYVNIICRLEYIKYMN